MLPQKHPGHSSIGSGLPAGSAATERPAQRASPSYRSAAPTRTRRGPGPPKSARRCLSESPLLLRSHNLRGEHSGDTYANGRLTTPEKRRGHSQTAAVLYACLCCMLMCMQNVHAASFQWRPQPGLLYLLWKRRGTADSRPSPQRRGEPGYSTWPTKNSLRQRGGKLVP